MITLNLKQLFAYLAPSIVDILAGSVSKTSSFTDSMQDIVQNPKLPSSTAAANIVDKLDDFIDVPNLKTMSTSPIDTSVFSKVANNDILDETVDNAVKNVNLKSQFRNLLDNSSSLYGGYDQIPNNVASKFLQFNENHPDSRLRNYWSEPGRTMEGIRSRFYDDYPSPEDVEEYNSSWLDFAETDERSQDSRYNYWQRLQRIVNDKRKKGINIPQSFEQKIPIKTHRDYIIDDSDLPF